MHAEQGDRRRRRLRRRPTCNGVPYDGSVRIQEATADGPFRGAAHARAVL
jgi:hypothetical protein